MSRLFVGLGLITLVVLILLVVLGGLWMMVAGVFVLVGGNLAGAFMFILGLAFASVAASSLYEMVKS